MDKKTDYSDFFDDNFEVTYDADYEPISTVGSDPTERIILPDNSGSHTRKKQKENHLKKIPAQSQKKEPYRRRGVPLAAPIRKGGRILSRLTLTLVRSLTAILILATTAYVCWTFFRASAPYGDIADAVKTKQLTLTLASYLFLPAVFFFFELISLFWSVTRVRVRDGHSTWKEDTGRGLFSFIAVFAISYLAFLFSGYLPESSEILTGVKGALDVYGSMHNVLFGLCAAGAVSCIVRKYI